MNQQRIIRTTLTVPSELWTKVRIEKWERGDESLNDVVIRALRMYFVVADFDSDEGLDHELYKLDPGLREGMTKALMEDE